jgi:hypothetical protein
LPCDGFDDEETCTDIVWGGIEGCILYNSAEDQHYCAIYCDYFGDCPDGQMCEDFGMGNVCYPDV